MAETVDERVSVDLLSNHIPKRAYPWILQWQGRRYRFTSVGLHYTFRDGETLIHMFTVSDGTTCFKLRFDTKTLSWKLVEVETQ